jgi:hypothetical protein
VDAMCNKVTFTGVQRPEGSKSKNETVFIPFDIALCHVLFTLTSILDPIFITKTDRTARMNDG